MNDLILLYDDFKINNNELYFLFEFNNELFNNKFIENLKISFNYLLENLIDNPNLQIKDYIILNENSNLLLEKWSKNENKNLNLI
jgi:hypothetical protein